MNKYNFEATEDYFKQIKELGIIYKYVLQSLKPNSKISNQYHLFFKTAFVLQSSKFEVFVESIIEEFIFELKSMEISYSQISNALKYSAIKVYYKQAKLESLLQSFDKFDEFSKKIKEINSTVNEDVKISDSFEVISQFNQHGSSEITNLFKQINNEDIFELLQQENLNIKSDIDRLINVRNNIVHRDTNITTLSSDDFKRIYKSVISFVEFVDQYLGNIKQKFSTSRREL